jgi:hypothetical protein
VLAGLGIEPLSDGFNGDWLYSGDAYSPPHRSNHC